MKIHCRQSNLCDNVGIEQLRSYVIFVLYLGLFHVVMTFFYSYIFVRQSRVPYDDVMTMESHVWCSLDRPGAIQTRHQVKHVKHFEEWLKDVRIVFGQPKLYYMVGQDLQGFMIRQHKYLHGQEARDLRCIPKVNQHTIKVY